jgi:hypothetical protein
MIYKLCFPPPQVCSLLHIRYKHFTPQLLESLLKIFAPPPKSAPESDEKGARLSKRRTALRLLTELLMGGVVTDSGALVGVIKELSKPDQAKDREAAQAAGTLLVAFLKQAKEPLGLSPAAEAGSGLVRLSPCFEYNDHVICRDLCERL